MEYFYTKNNLLEHVEKYRYPPFYGKDFLVAYFESRNQFVSKLDKKGSLYVVNEDKIIDNNKSAGNTFLYFKRFLGDYEKSDINKDNGFVILLKRFEVTKKIYSEYDEKTFRWKKDSSNTELELYVYFSICCSKAYEKSKHLSFLNALIKCNDILCSQKVELFPETIINLLRLAIENELKYVKHLINEKGIILHAC
ncbi:MAG: hypothetical protein IJT36_05280 [Alphaproteobacteria bacterium]|nr:hypothetical protein [Alphaproteobacteria bacterium]